MYQLTAITQADVPPIITHLEVKGQSRPLSEVAPSIPTHRNTILS